MTRLLDLNGTRNLRDLGGYPTVDGRQTHWRMLYRSDCLDQLDDAGQTWLIDAGLRTIVDLRGAEEVADKPNVFATSEQVRYRHIPFWEGPLPEDFDPDLSKGYMRELDLCGDRLVAIFAALLEPDALPALIHCAAGKDRTGIAVGLLLDAAGVTRQVIGEDYALSAQCLGPEYVAEGRIWVARIGREWERWAHTFETPPERMLNTLEYADRHFGGTAAYLRRNGLDESQVERLRDLLIAQT